VKKKLARVRLFFSWRIALKVVLVWLAGHICDMDALSCFCKELGITLIEDCAHSLGSYWNGQAVGSFGVASCYSSQTNKLLNSGEGGIVTTEVDLIAARIILLSGSYGHYASSGAVLAPAGGEGASLSLRVLEAEHNHTPNYSLRMTNLTAALLRPQLTGIKAKVALFNRHWDILERDLGADALFFLPPRPAGEDKVGTSFQFWLPSFQEQQLGRFVELALSRGLSVSWFGRPEPAGFTSNIRHWGYIFDNKPISGEDALTTADPELPKTLEVMRTLCDVPLYHTSTWSDGDFEAMAQMFRECAAEAWAQL